MPELCERIKELDKLAMRRANASRAKQFASKANSEQHLVALIEKAEAVIAEFCKLPAVTRHHEKVMPLSCAIFDLRSQISTAGKRSGVRR